MREKIESEKKEEISGRTKRRSEEPVDKHFRTVWRYPKGQTDNTWFTFNRVVIRLTLSGPISYRVYISVTTNHFVTVPRFKKNLLKWFPAIVLWSRILCKYVLYHYHPWSTKPKIMLWKPPTKKKKTIFFVQRYEIVSVQRHST